MMFLLYFKMVSEGVLWEFYCIRMGFAFGFDEISREFVCWFYVISLGFLWHISMGLLWDV